MIGYEVGDRRISLLPRELAAADGAPPERTLKYWKTVFTREKRLPKHIPLPPPQSLLSTDQSQVLAGYMLWRLRQNLVVDQDCLRDFISAAFKMHDVTNGWLSKHVKQLGFSRHLAASTPRIYDQKKSVIAAIDFVNEVQPILKAVRDKGRIVAIDQISFWDNGHVTWCYALIGGYDMRFSVVSVFSC
jgi:hypothetical protein